ncbi:MAG TPA: FAD-dependent oxidoreductase [Chitinophagaceae bacterium]|nr:FAD-dependent oxidoreductase [Chitinophagaceae bacterium]
MLPSEAASSNIIIQYLASATGKKPAAITGFHILKQSIDARGKTPRINLTCNVFINEPFHNREITPFSFRDVHQANRKAIIVGAGPAGLFAALKLIENGIQPIVLERGKDVRARRRDLAALNKEGIINPNSNYCFGEGGAGTYSDGKLYTRSTKRGDVNRILNLLVHFGAAENILYESHPHIGTNKLPQIITAIRKQITDSGGLFLFEKKVTQLLVDNHTIKGVTTADGQTFEAEAVILATGHSARDIFQLLHQQQIEIAFKPFALGVRIEHPQSLIDSIQYHSPNRSEFLPPASYSLVQQVSDHGVFSFCMCPGGIIAPAATAPGEVVVNGWSPSKRNNPFANSGIVVNVEEKDVQQFKKHQALAGLYFQQMVEQKAYEAGGGKFVAPAQRMTDFVEGKLSATLPDCSYLPGIRPAKLGTVLPPFVFKGLQQAFLAFGKKMKGYLTNEAVVVATESRTSSPVRIPRNAATLEHPHVHGLYPCGEGAGYAGGIVSAAMDGERVAQQILERHK